MFLKCKVHLSLYQTITLSFTLQCYSLTSTTLSTYNLKTTTSKTFLQAFVKPYNLDLGATVAHVLLESPKCSQGQWPSHIHGVLCKYCIKQTSVIILNVSFIVNVVGKISRKTRLTLRHDYRRPTVDTVAFQV